MNALTDIQKMRPPPPPMSAARRLKFIEAVLAGAVPGANYTGAKRSRFYERIEKALVFSKQLRDEAERDKVCPK